MTETHFKVYYYRRDKRPRKTLRRWLTAYKGCRTPGLVASRRAVGRVDAAREKKCLEQVRNLKDHRTHWHPGNSKLNI